MSLRLCWSLPTMAPRITFPLAKVSLKLASLWFISNHISVADTMDDLVTPVSSLIMPSNTRSSIFFGRSISPELVYDSFVYYNTSSATFSYNIEQEQFIYYLRNSNKWYIPVCVLINLPSNPQISKKLIRLGFTEYIPAPLSFDILYSTMGTVSWIAFCYSVVSCLTMIYRKSVWNRASSRKATEWRHT